MLAASDSLAAAVSATGATSGVSKVNNKTPTPLSSINVGPPLPAGSLQGQSGSGGKAGSGGQQKKQGQEKKSSKSPGPVPAFAAAAAAGAASKVRQYITIQINAIYQTFRPLSSYIYVSLFRLLLTMNRNIFRAFLF